LANPCIEYTACINAKYFVSLSFFVTSFLEGGERRRELHALYVCIKKQMVSIPAIMSDLVNYGHSMCQVLGLAELQ